MKKIKIVTVVWGEDYIDLFLNITLPSWMSEEDIGNKKLMENIDFTIYTHSLEDQRMIETHPTYQRLQTMLPVDVHAIVRFGLRKFESVNTIHRKIIGQHRAGGYDGMIILFPDSLLNIGAFKHVIAKAQDYKLIYNIVNLRVNYEGVMPVYGEYVNKNGTITSDNLFRLLRDHTHIITKSYTVTNNGMGNQSPCTALWEVNDDCWIGRAMHQYPFYIEMDYLLPFADRPIHPYMDSAIINSQNIKPSDIYVITDSDQVLLVDVAHIDPKDYKLGLITYKGYKLDDLLNYWFKISTKMNPILTPLDIEFKLHCGDNKTNWKEKSKEVDDIVQQYYHLYLGK